MDNSYYPYFAIGGNELCFTDDVPECILNSDHFDESLDQFYYSFMYVIEQDCADVNDDGILNILDVLEIINAINNNTSEALECGDVNGDGIINILDVITLLNLILE